jgi:zinc transport system substrate-binding protein
MIVYLDDEVDNWVSEALERADREHIKKIALSECEGVIKHDISSTSHTHDGEEHHHSHDEHDHKTFDEHLWLSIKNAVQISEALCDALCQLDPSGEENYRSNTAKYLEQLGRLDEEYKNAVSHVDAEDRFMMFCDRFPFVYLLEDYGIEYAAAFEGCSTDVDADFDTVLRLIEEVESHGVDFVTVTESTDGALAETVTNSVKGREVGVLCMDSMQAVSRKQIESGKTYLSVMEENLRVLKIALGAQD